MESGEEKAEAQVVMSKDEAILVENNGEIDALKEEKSLTENLNVRKRGRFGENHDEDKNQGCGESNSLVMKTGGSERQMVTYKRRGRVKREKGQEDVDMKENRCDVRDNEKSTDLVQENGGAVSAVEEGKVDEEDKENCDSSSSYADCSRGKKLEEGDSIAEKEEENDSEKERSKVEAEGRCLGVRQSRIRAMEKIKTVLNVTDDKDDGLSNRGKKGIHKKMNNNGTSLEENEVGAKIAQMEDEKTKLRRSSRCKGKGKGEGEELNEIVTKGRVGRKMDDNGFLESTMCHQCQRNDKGGIVRCTKCKTKRYCHHCIKTWYANVILIQAYTAP